MGRRKNPVSPEIREQAIRLFLTENDNNTRVIAEKLGVHKGVIENILDIAFNDGTIAKAK